MASRILQISDVHSNLPALEAVLEDAEKQGPYDLKLCTGDVVGYGPHPNEVIERLQDEGFEFVQGNHDRAVLDGSWVDFNESAWMAANLNRDALSEDSKEFLGGLSSKPRMFLDDRVGMVHGSIGINDAKPGIIYELVHEDEYMPLPSRNLSMRLPEEFLSPVIWLFGHTHYASLFAATRKVYSPGTNEFAEASNGYLFDPQVNPDLEQEILLNFDMKEEKDLILFFNPGSVGQPRSSKYHAELNGYAATNARYGIVTIDEDKVTIINRNVPYNIERTRNDLFQNNYPESLRDRLLKGI